VRAPPVLGVATAIMAVASSLPADAGDLSMANIRVSSRGFDAGGEFCSDFSLSDRQAREFFQRASKISPAKQHELPHIPCYVRGTGEQGGRAVTWEIRAGGTGFVAAPDGTITLIGCERACDRFLR
jgi:hypothetical protein